MVEKGFTNQPQRSRVAGNSVVNYAGVISCLHTHYVKSYMYGGWRGILTSIVTLQDEEKSDQQHGQVYTCAYIRMLKFITYCSLLCVITTRHFFLSSNLSLRWMEYCRERMNWMKEGGRLDTHITCVICSHDKTRPIGLQILMNM